VGGGFDLRVGRGPYRGSQLRRDAFGARDGRDFPGIFLVLVVGENEGGLVRRAVLLLGMVAAMLLLASRVALAAVLTGTGGPDAISGTLGSDAASGGEGRDIVDDGPPFDD
jgi:hypothetical protein